MPISRSNMSMKIQLIVSRAGDRTYESDRPPWLLRRTADTRCLAWIHTSGRTRRQQAPPADSANNSSEPLSPVGEVSLALEFHVFVGRGENVTGDEPDP